jgi:hypothetical protein
VSFMVSTQRFLAADAACGLVASAHDSLRSPPGRKCV